MTLAYLLLVSSHQTAALEPIAILTHYEAGVNVRCALRPGNGIEPLKPARTPRAVLLHRGDTVTAGGGKATVYEGKFAPKGKFTNLVVGDALVITGDFRRLPEKSKRRIRALGMRAGSSMGSSDIMLSPINNRPTHRSDLTLRGEEAQARDWTKIVLSQSGRNFEWSIPADRRSQLWSVKGLNVPVPSTLEDGSARLTLYSGDNHVAEKRVRLTSHGLHVKSDVATVREWLQKTRSGEDADSDQFLELVGELESETRYTELLSLFILCAHAEPENPFWREKVEDLGKAEGIAVSGLRKLLPN